MKKFPERYGTIYKENSPFSRYLKNCLYNSITTEQFDGEWKTIMEGYKLTKDEWLINLFDIRQSWVPLYNRSIFYAGMNTTQRCESIHSFFDEFLNKGTTLREFVIKYEHAMEHRYRAEHAEQFVSIYKKPILKLKSSLEEQAVDVCVTSSINSEMSSWKATSSAKRSWRKVDPKKKYKAINFHNPNEAFVVTLDVESWEVFCECHLFEFQGILCRHVLAIFNKNDVAKIPQKYILPRWTKKAAEGISIPFFKKDVDKASMVRDLQFNNMISQMRPYLHASTNAFDIIMDGLDKTFKRVVNLEENQEVNEGAMVTIGRAENNVEQLLLANPPL